SAKSTTSTGPALPAVGKARIAATSRTGTVLFPTGTGTVCPTCAPAARRNARVAMAGTGSLGAPAVRVSWPVTGSTGTPGRWTRSPAPGRKVSVAPAGVARQEATAGWVPWVSLGSAKAAADAAACHAPSRLAAANPAGKLPDAVPEAG